MSRPRFLHAPSIFSFRPALIFVATFFVSIAALSRLPPLRSALGMPNITLKVMDRDSFALFEVDSRPLPALSEVRG